MSAKIKKVPNRKQFNEEIIPSGSEWIAAGFDRETVERVARLVIVNEYKRRQAAPGVRITPRAFGRDRRYPITSGFRR